VAGLIVLSIVRVKTLSTLSVVGISSASAKERTKREIKGNNNRLFKNISILEMSLARAQYKIFLADYLNPLNDKTCRWVRQGALVARLGTDGQYKWCFIGKEKEALALYGQKTDIEVCEFPGGIIAPGFYDMHFHWVQDEVRTMPKDSLLKWLSEYTWPHEAKFKSLDFTKKKAKAFSRDLLKAGTIGGACYASIHGHSVDWALKEFKGDYIVGNVLMTMNSPKYLTQTKLQAKKLIKSKSNKFLKKYAMTPRFAPTTHPEVMKEGSKIAKTNKSFIQTHLSETKNEINYVLGLYKEHKGFEKIKSYTEIYKKCGLLGPRTIMGHGIHLSEDELSMLSKSKTAVAHCPTSNAPVKDLGLGSGLFDFKKVEKAKVRWALATDIGGGPFLSMLDVMKSFVTQNKSKKVTGATYTKALYRATQAGADLLQLSSSRGNFQRNKLAHFIILEKPSIRKEDKAEDVLKRMLRGSRENLGELVSQTFLNGESVYQKV
jgi:guanine deaminase